MVTMIEDMNCVRDGCGNCGGVMMDDDGVRIMWKKWSSGNCVEVSLCDGDDDDGGGGGVKAMVW